MTDKTSPPEMDWSHLLISEVEERESRGYLRSEEISKTVKVYPDRRYLFYTLFEDAKNLLRADYDYGSWQAEVIMVIEGNKILHKMLRKYNIMPIQNLYRKLIKTYDIPAIKRIPELNLSTVIDSNREKNIIIHLTPIVHGIVSKWSRLLNTTNGDIVYSNIMLYFNSLWADAPYDNNVLEYINIQKRLDSCLKNYNDMVIEHIISMIDEMQTDIDDYESGLKNSRGDVRTIDRKQKLLTLLKDMV